MNTKFKISSYQQKILDSIDSTSDNLLIDAKAGSGKTSTLLLIADSIVKQHKKCLFLAFNKSIVTELEQKILSFNCSVRTLHSLGFLFVRNYLDKKYPNNYILEKPNPYKVNELVKVLVPKYCGEDIQSVFDQMTKDTLPDIIDDFVKLIKYIRLNYIDLNDKNSIDMIRNQKCSYLNNLDQNGLGNYMDVVKDTFTYIDNNILEPTYDESKHKYTFTLDYEDMIYLPVKFNMPIPRSIESYLNYILVDESQDLNVLQQHLIKMLNNNTRYIFVGDRKQAIYGFAGADTHSIQTIKQNFNLTELPLNICYRCPRNIIRITQTIVPDIEYNKDRLDMGNVRLMPRSLLKDYIEPRDMIIARKNKDLLKVFTNLVLKNHVQVKFKNQDLVNSIVKDIKKCILEYIKRYNKHLNVEVLLDKARINAKIPLNKKLRDKAQNKFIDDTYKSLIQQKTAQDIKSGKKIVTSSQSLTYLLTCMDEYKSLGECGVPTMDTTEIEYFDIIYSLITMYNETSKPKEVNSFIDWMKQFLNCANNKDVPVLSSIHQMKGSEADNVYIIDYPQFPYKFDGQSDEELQQESNLQYVALTRAKKTLTLLLIPQDSKNSSWIEESNKKCIEQIKGLVPDTEFIQY